MKNDHERILRSSGRSYVRRRRVVKPNMLAGYIAGTAVGVAMASIFLFVGNAGNIVVLQVTGYLAFMEIPFLLYYLKKSQEKKKKAIPK